MIRKKQAIYKGIKYRRVSFSDENDHTVCDKINCIYGRLSSIGDWIVASKSQEECKGCTVIRRKLNASFRSFKYTFVYDS
jgi:hypothetical protein